MHRNMYVLYAEQYQYKIYYLVSCAYIPAKNSDFLTPEKDYLEKTSFGLHNMNAKTAVGIFEVFLN